MNCPKCGAEMPEHANFCTKCGEKLGKALAEQKPVEQTEQQPTVNSQPPAMAEQQHPKQSAFDVKKVNGFLAERFMPTFVIMGVIAWVLKELSALFIFSTYWLGIVLGVFSILFAFVFCMLGIYRYWMLKPQDGKHTNADIICFAIGIIAFIFVLITSIVVMVTGGSLQDILAGIA